MVDQKKLILCVGLPRSGKTTWAREQGVPIVNPDSIRLALHGQRFVAEAEEHVWAIAKTMVRALFLAGHDVVIMDACNNTRKRRGNWLSNDWITYVKLIPTTAGECRYRADVLKDDYILPIIDRMAEEWEPLGDFEPRWPE